MAVTTDAERVSALVNERGADDLSEAIFDWLSAESREHLDDALGIALDALGQQRDLADADAAQHDRLPRLDSAIRALGDLRDEIAELARVRLCDVRDAIHSYANEAR